MGKVTVRRYMTPSPHTIGADQPLATAERIMREHHIRHLPVLHGGRLAGIVSQSDLRVVEALDGAEQLAVEEAMTPDPYTITPDSSLEWVATEMAERKFGSVVVVDHEHVVGVLTTVDALRALQDLLRESRQSGRPHHPPGA